MDFGIYLPIDLKAPTAGGYLREVAEQIEGLGFDSLWTGDHVAIPRKAKSAYPYPDPLSYAESSHPIGTSGTLDEQNGSDLPGIPDALGVLQFVAACTRRVQLGTSVLILPMRNPVITAQQVATLDILSDGRCILGVGVGWNREEFETLNAPFEHRGARTDEYLEVMRRLWTLDDPSFEGKFYKVGDVLFDPKPIQKPHPAYWFGGNEEPALRRTIRFKGTWHFAFLNANDVGVRVARLRQLAEEAGQDPLSIPVTGLRIDILYKSAKDASAEIEALEAAGVSHVIVGSAHGDMKTISTGLSTFAREVMARHRGA